MIERLGDKQKPCTYCTGYGHTAFKCPKRPRPTLRTHKGLKVSSSFGGQRKPMNKVGKVTRTTNAAVAKWKLTQTPPYVCHYCHKLVPYLMAEHMESKARRPDLRTDLANFVPVCASCNALKGSKSHSEMDHVCTL